MLSGLALVALFACSGVSKQTASPGSASSRPAVQPSPAETHPPGDIPDTQAFVTYRSPLRYSVLFPEGWSQLTQASSVRFEHDYDGEEVVVRTLSAVPSARDDDATVRLATAPFHGVREVTVKRLTMAAGPALLIGFSSQSQPNSVTGRSLRLENSTYVFTKDHRLALLNLWAPLGSDNVDQWRKMAESFRWR